MANIEASIRQEIANYKRHLTDLLQAPSNASIQTLIAEQKFAILRIEQSYEAQKKKIEQYSDPLKTRALKSLDLNTTRSIDAIREIIASSVAKITNISKI